MGMKFKRSYRDRKQAVAKRKKFTIKIIITIFIFQVIYTFFLSTIKIESISMEPSLDEGSMMIYSPLTYGFRLKLMNSRLPEIGSPKRGDLIVFSPPYLPAKRGFVSVISPFVSFITFNKINLSNVANRDWENPFLIKRILAVPGDTIRVESFIAYIKSDESDFFLSEFEVITSDYDTNIGKLPEGWNNSVPFSGNMDQITLKEDEFFVLGDNRLQSNDSLSWGVLARDRIEGKILMQYWPVNKISIK